MINRILKSVYEDDSDLLTDKDVLDIEKSMQDLKSGKFTTNKELKKKHGLWLGLQYGLQKHKEN